MDHEGELAVVIGRRCKGIFPEEFARYVLGYTCLNDVTARDLQKADVQFTRGKSFDTFCPLGPLIETEVNLAMAEWLRDAARVLRQGLVLLIDYGRPAHDYYAPERTRGTLRAFSKHKVSADFLDPGAMVDLTADVDFTSLALDARQAGFIPLAFLEMGTFLMSAIGESFKPAPADWVRLRYLLHPEGLGSMFHVLILGRHVDPLDWVFEHNRIARLGLDRAMERR